MEKVFYPQIRLLWLWLVGWSLLALVLTLVLLVVFPFLWGLALGAFLLVLGIVWLWLYFKSMRLQVGETVVVLTMGVLFHHVKRLSMHALQGVVIHADLPSRLVGIRTLVLRMPGFSGIFMGLSPTDAEALSDYLCQTAFAEQEEDP